MGVFEAALWGLLQGLTEFLPVSSSGHLVLIPWLVGLDAPGFTFDVAVHFATLLAVVLYFHREVAGLFRGLGHILATRRIDTPESRLAALVFISSIPAVIAGALLSDFIDSLFGTPLAVAVFLIVTSAVLYLADRRAGTRAVFDLTPRDAGLIGLAQAVALAPGISRSGATIATGLALGMARPEAARYSFVMSIPVVFGAAALEAWDTFSAGVTVDWLPIAVGMAVAFAVGMLAIHTLLRHLQRHGLRVFSVYLWALGALSLIVYLVR